MTPAADEVYSSGDELSTKVRKPYTITKQRERWTEEEHQKFLEALKLYGRAWRRIEEHIGTKTAVQTRSHAQKFFSKLVRESSGGGVCSLGQAQNIEIPPPRPKRKPRHPYPRKAGTALQSGSSTIEGGNISPPVSSLPGLRLGVGLDKSAGFDRCNETENLCDSISTQETEMERARMNTSPSSLKLFGQTMFLSTVQMTTGASVKPFVSNNSGGAFRKFASLKQAIVPQKTATYDKPRLDEGKELEQAPGPMAHMKLVAKSAKFSGSAYNATMTSELGTGILAGCSLSGADGKHADKQDSGEHSSCKLDINSNYLPRKQEAPNVMTGHPRHVPVQCVVDGMVPESIHKCAKSWPVLAPLVHQSSAISMPNGNSSYLNSDAMNSWPSRFPPGFPWMQMQQGDTSAVGAVAASNVAAASAWWSFYGAAPSPFIYPAIYAAANPTFACNGEHVMGARQQKKMKMTEREGEILLSAMPINLQMDTEGKSTSFHKQNDSKSLILEASDHADCMSQGSQSQNYTPSCMEGSNDIGHADEQSCETEEQELKMKGRWLSKEGSSSGSNTPSSNEAEIDPCLGTSTEDNMGDYVQDFQFSGGRCVSEAEEDASNEKEEVRDCNNPSTKQAEVMGSSGKHIYKDRCNSWSKGDGHFNDIWKEVSDEGRAAFQALFSQEVLPQSFSLPNNFGDAMYPKVDTKESLYKDTKQSLGWICENKAELEVLCSVAAQNARYTGNGHTYGPRTSDTTQMVLEASGATTSAQSEESATTECAAVNAQEAIKCMDTPSFGRCRSAGVGFVPYQRCSIQPNKKHVIPGNL